MCKSIHTPIILLYHYYFEIMAIIEMHDFCAKHLCRPHQGCLLTSTYCTCMSYGIHESEGAGYTTVDRLHLLNTVAEKYTHLLAFQISCSPENMTCSPENFTCSPENFTCSPENFTCSPENFTCSPQNFTSSPVKCSY